MENSIEKDEEILNNIKTYMQENIDKGWHKFVYNDLGYDEKCVDVINAIEHILSEYKRVLKENEELRVKWDKDTHILQNKLDYANADRIDLAQQNKELKQDYYNLINKIENKIDRFDYEFEKAKRQNDKDKSDYYWDLIINFKKMLESEE